MRNELEYKYPYNELTRTLNNHKARCFSYDHVGDVVDDNILSREAEAPAMPKVKPKRRYNNLSEFRDYLEANCLETILSFTGYELITKRARYWMIDGTVRSEPRGRGRRQ